MLELDMLDAEPLGIRPVLRPYARGSIALMGAAPDLTDFNKQAFAQRKAQILQLKTRPGSELRSWAREQIDKVRSHYDGLSWVSKHTPILSAKFDPVLSSLDQADGQFKFADAESDEAKANGRYVLALLSATDAANSLAEATATSIAEDLIEILAEGAQLEKEKLTEATSSIIEAGAKGVAGGIGIPSWALWTGAAVAGVAVLGLPVLMPLLIARAGRAVVR